MNEENNKKTEKNERNDSFINRTFHTYRAEFRKIVWPSKETLTKHTITVIAVSLMFGAYIALMDGGFGIVFRQFVDLVN